MNEKAFFDVVETHLGHLKDSQVSGFNTLIGKWNASKLVDVRWFAYMLATAWHETWYTMQPISEVGTPSYLEHKPYWPYIGRGYVQMTWKSNYERYGIASDPSKALEPDIAAHILIDGMVHGIFTGASLKKYFSGAHADPINARRVINSLDHAVTIAGYYAVFHHALLELYAVEKKLA